MFVGHVKCLAILESSNNGGKGVSSDWMWKDEGCWSTLPPSLYLV